MFLNTIFFLFILILILFRPTTLEELEAKLYRKNAHEPSWPGSMSMVQHMQDRLLKKSMGKEHCPGAVSLTENSSDKSCYADISKDSQSNNPLALESEEQKLFRKFVNLSREPYAGNMSITQGPNDKMFMKNISQESWPGSMPMVREQDKLFLNCVQKESWASNMQVDDSLLKRNVPKGSWSEDDMQRAIDIVNQGIMTMRAAAKHFNVPRSSLQRHVRGKVTEPGKKHLGYFRPVIKQFEAELVERAIQYSNICDLTPNALLTLAFELTEERQLPPPYKNTSNKSGIMWVKRFLSRHPEVHIDLGEPTKKPGGR